MEQGIAQATLPEPIDGSFERQGLLGWLRIYFRPLLVLIIAVPLTLLAIVRSTDWFSAPFPSFLLMENAVVPTVSGYDWPPEKARIFHGRVVSVDGEAVASSADVYDRVAARPAGTGFVFGFEKAGEAYEIALPSRSFTSLDYLQIYAILLLIGVMSLLTGLVVGFMRPQMRQARVYLILAFVGCLFSTTPVFLHQAGFPLLTAVYFTAEAFFPATFIHLALVFPVERSFPGAQRLLLAVPYLVSACLTMVTLRGFHAEPPDLTGLHITYLYIAFSFLFFLSAMVYAYRENREPLARPRIKAMLPSVALGGTLSVFAFTNNAFAGGNFPLQLGFVFVPAFYASLAYAIAKHDLFDIDRVVRQSFVYGLLSIIVISGYALVLAVPTQFVPGFVGDNRALTGMAFVVLLAFALDPLRRVVQNVIDRAFYRTRLDYRATISNLSAVMTTLLDLGQVVTQATRVVTDSMHLEVTALCLFHPEGKGGTLWSRSSDSDLTEQIADDSVEDLREVFLRFPLEFNAATIPARLQDPAEQQSAARFLEDIGASIVLPLMIRNQPIGIFVLGPRRSGQPFSWDDITLLRTLANQTAIAVQNARSYRDLEELNRDLDAKVRQRTQELSQAYDDLKKAQAKIVQSEKMASLGQLVAGVAHELNNPAALVHGSLENLEEYLGQFVEVIRLYEEAPITDSELSKKIEDLRSQMEIDVLIEETPELLKICTEGSERIRKIVEDLRVFVRADRGQRAPTNIVEGLDSTIRMLRKRTQELGIEVDTHYEEVPNVEAHSGQLNQVWMNLVGNALDAVEGRPDGAVRVVVQRCAPLDEADTAAAGDRMEADWVQVEVTDNGVGINPDDLDKIFDPFFTTKPIGRGTGLGLSIVYGAVRDHGGVVSARSEAGMGTVMTVSLPIQERAPQAAITDEQLASAAEG